MLLNLACIIVSSAVSVATGELLLISACYYDLLLLLYCTDDEVGDDGLLDDEEDGQIEGEAEEDVSFEQESGETGEGGKEGPQKQQKDGGNASGKTAEATAVKDLTDAEVCWCVCNMLDVLYFTLLMHVFMCVTEEGSSGREVWCCKHGCKETG